MSCKMTSSSGIQGRRQIVEGIFQVLFSYHFNLALSAEKTHPKSSISMPDDQDPSLQTRHTLNNEVAMNESDDTTEPPPEGPTDSHVLSQIEPDEKGLTQQAGDSTDVTDLGWRSPADTIEEPLIAGLLNEDLWMLIRRFDKVNPQHGDVFPPFSNMILNFRSKFIMSRPYQMPRCRILI